MSKRYLIRQVDVRTWESSEEVCRKASWTGEYPQNLQPGIHLEIPRACEIGWEFPIQGTSHFEVMELE